MSDASSTDLPVAAVLRDTRALAAAAPRPLGAVLVLAGLAHLLVPGLLLGVAGRGYDQVLGVDFRPREHATTRVRALGFAMVAAGAHLLYHGGVKPR